MLDLVSILRGLREFIVEKFDAETADRVCPSWKLDGMQISAAQPQPADGDQPAFAELPPELQAEADRLKAGQAQLDADRAAFIKEQARSRRSADTAFIGDLVKQGRLLPAQKGDVLAFMDAIGEASTLAFGEGAQRRDQSPREWFRSFVAGLPKQVAFGEHAPAKDLDGKAPRFPVPAGTVVDPERAELHAKALQYQEAHQGVTYIQAVMAISKE